MPEVPGASEHSVNNAKISFMRIYLFKYASTVLNNWAVAIVTNSIYHYLSLFVDNKDEHKLITY